MAEEQGTMDYNNVMLELQRIEQLEHSNEEILSQLKVTEKAQTALEKSNDALMENVGLKDDIKKKNVIDGDKLSSTLTTSEKKRYENIGKEFIAGAGKEFENIRKAVKFNEMMSTVKKKFSLGVINFKENLKKIKKSGFLGKLIIIIGLLGTIVALFKDKITAVLPNIGDKITEIFTSVKECIGNIITNIFQFVTNGIGTSFMNIMREVVTNVVPKFIGTFFQVTLPNAIVNLYLGVLSAFSGDAQDLFDQRIKADIDEETEKVAENAEQELKLDALNEEKGYISVIQQLDKAKTEIDNETAQMNDYITVKRDSGLFAMMRDKDFQSVLKELDRLVEGDQDFKKLIDSGQLNVTKFLQEVKSSQDKGKLTNESIFNAIKESMSVSAFQEGFEMSSKIKADAISNFSNSLLRMSESSTSTRTEMDSKISELRDKEEETKRALTEYKQTINEINAKDVIAGTLADNFSNLVNKIVDFIEGNKLKTIVVQGLTDVNKRFKKFFEGFNTQIKKVIDSLHNAFITANQLIIEAAGRLTSVQQFFEEKGVDTVDTSNNLNMAQNMYAIVNIDLSQTSPEGNTIKGIVQEVVSIDNRLHTLMTATNLKIQSVIDGLAKIKNLHTNSKNYLEKRLTEKCGGLETDIVTNKIEIGKNKKSINDIKSALIQPIGKPKPIRHIAPCLDVS